MIVIKLWLYAVILTLTLSLVNSSSAQDSVLENSRTLAVIPVVKGSINQSVYRQFDRLVPELKRLSGDKIVRLECRYAGQAEREQDVVSAYQTSSRIEKYLRVQHQLELDLWITIRLTSKQSKASPVLTIAVYADDISNLNSTPVGP